MFRRDIQRLRHERHDVGLRDRLTVADWQRRIAVGVGAVRFGHEQVTRYGEHRGEHTRGADIPRAELAVDHAPPVGVPMSRVELGIRSTGAAGQARDEHGAHPEVTRHNGDRIANPFDIGATVLRLLPFLTHSVHVFRVKTSGEAPPRYAASLITPRWCADLWTRAQETMSPESLRSSSRDLLVSLSDR